MYCRTIGCKIPPPVLSASLTSAMRDNDRQEEVNTHTLTVTPVIILSHQSSKASRSPGITTEAAVLLQGFLVLAVACFVASSIKSRHKDKMVELVNALSVVTIIGLAVAGMGLRQAGLGVWWQWCAVITGIKGLLLPNHQLHAWIKPGSSLHITV